MKIIEEKTVKARKEHRCGACRGAINKGGIYNNQILTDCHEIYTFKICETCIYIIKSNPKDFSGEIEAGSIEPTIEDKEKAKGFLRRTRWVWEI